MRSYLLNLNTVEKFWLDRMLLQELTEHDLNPEGELMTYNVAYREYLQYAEALNDSNLRLSRYEFIQTTKRFCPEIEVGSPLNNDVMLNLPPLKLRRKRFEEYTGIKFEWD